MVTVSSHVVLLCGPGTVLMFSRAATISRRAEVLWEVLCDRFSHHTGSLQSDQM